MLTTAGREPARRRGGPLAVLGDVGSWRARSRPLLGPARDPLRPRAGPRGPRRRSVGPGGRCRWPRPAAPASRGWLKWTRGPGGGRPDLPPGHRFAGADGAVRGAAPGGPQRAPAEHQVRLAVADDHRGHHHQHRPRPVGAAEDRGHFPARPGPGELRLLLHAQGLQEHRPVAVLVRQHVLRGRPRVRDRRPESRARPGGRRRGPLPAAGAQPAAGRQARAGQRSPWSLPRPQLPQSVHDVTIDNILSQAIATQHSWTYPGLGCGVLLKPQFAQSVLYAQAQAIAFYKATHDARSPRPLIGRPRPRPRRPSGTTSSSRRSTRSAIPWTGFTLRWSGGP